MIRVVPTFGNFEETMTELVVKVDNNEDKYYYEWPLEKFYNRLYMIRDVVNNYYETGDLPDFDDKDYDPFWDPPEPLLIGISYMSLHNMLFSIENELNALIFSSEGHDGARGEIRIMYYPCDSTGEGDCSEDLLVDEPE